jgi:hypothetical protein
MSQPRQPPLLNTARYGVDDNHQIQRAIQSLRFKTQESLAESREEIARLEEENEIKQMRIEEIDAEIQLLEAEQTGDRRASLMKIENAGPRGRSQRRWSLAALGANFVHQGDTDAHSKQPKRRSKSVDEDSDGDYGVDDLPDELKGLKAKRFSLLAMKSKDRPSLRRSKNLKTKNESSSQVEREAILMERLHEIQEESKRLIEQQETNLKFKDEQVLALQLAYEEQENIIENLEEEIYQAREAVKKLSVENSPQEDAEEMKERLTILKDKENEISSQIRLIKRIRNMDSTERKSAISALKKDIVESSIRLNAVKRMFDANYAMLDEELIKKEEEWALLCVKVALMERVSLKQVRRLEKKAAKGGSTDLAELIERAIRALEEELEMREGSDEIARKVLQLETMNLEQLVVAMLDCCDSFAEGLQMLKSLEIAVPIGVGVGDTIRQMEKSISNAENTVSSAIFIVEETAVSYAHDDQLLPKDVQAAFLPPDDQVHSGAEDDEEVASSSVPEEDLELENLQDRNDELELKLREMRETLKGRRVLTKEVGDLASKIEGLISKYKEGGVQWDAKDDEFLHAMKEVEEAKIAEDRLREFLERTSRARLSVTK